MLVFILLITLSSCNGGSSKMNNYNQELFFQAQEKDHIIYKKDKIIGNIEKIYIPNNSLMLLSRVITYEDIRDILPFNNVEKTNYGFNIIFNMKDEKFVIITDYSGNVGNMIFYGKALYKERDFSKIDIGMTIDEVKNVFPLFILYDKIPSILNNAQTAVNPATIEIVFNNGEIGIIEMKTQNGEYIVCNKYYSDFKINKSIINQIN